MSSILSSGVSLSSQKAGGNSLQQAGGNSLPSPIESISAPLNSQNSAPLNSQNSAPLNSQNSVTSMVGGSVPQTLDLKTYKNQMAKQQQNQLSKMTFKSEADIEYLEMIKEYMQKRSDLELQHAKNVEKLAHSFANKKFRKYLGSTNTPLFYAGNKDESSEEQSPSSTAPAEPSAISTESRQIYKAFACLLEESERQSAKRIELSESIDASISKVLKDFYKLKASLTKKNIEFGVKYHQEILDAVDELERSRALYDKSSKDADAALKKLNEAMAKPKTGGLSALKSLVTGVGAEAVIQKLQAKFKHKTRSLNTARNNYLLAITSINSIQKLYDQDDLPLLLSKVDGFFYDVLANLLQKYTDLEGELTNHVNSCMDTIRLEIGQISRENDIQLFLKENYITFKHALPFAFEAVGLDECKEYTVDEITKIELGQRLGQLIALDNDFITLQETKEKELKGAEQLVDLYTAAPQSGNAVSPIELKQDIKNSLDLIKCQRTKILKQMDQLKALGIAPIMPENFDVGSKQQAVAKFGYVAQQQVQGNELELSVAEGEDLQVVGNAVQDGWIKVKSLKSGNVGVVPTSCITFISKPPPTSSSTSRIVVAMYDYKATDKTELSFKAGDEIECVHRVDVDEDDWEGKLVRTGQQGLFSKVLTKGWEAIAASEVKSLAELSRVASVSSKRPKSALLAKKVRGRSTSDASSFASSTIDYQNVAPLLDGLVAQMAKVGEMDEEDEEDEGLSATALFSYEATCEGELSIETGERITKISKDTGSEQWWTGTGKHGTGQFPSNYVLIGKAGSGTVGGIGKPAVPTKPVEKVRALYDFTPAAPGELGFKAGDILILKQSEENDWWDGELNGEVGAFPAAYVERI